MNFTYLALSIDEFFECISNGMLPFQADSLSKTLFIFHDFTWHDIINKFKHHTDINISGGSGGKRHLLSPMSLRLSAYMLAMFLFNFNLFKLNLMFDRVDKDKAYPKRDLTNFTVYMHEGEKIINPCYKPNLEEFINEMESVSKLGVEQEDKNQKDSESNPSDEMNPLDGEANSSQEKKKSMFFFLPLAV
jgi:hypothetical protein